MPIRLADLSDDEVHAAALAIDANGYALIKDYVAPSLLADMRAFVGAALRRSGGEYVDFKGEPALAGSVFDDILRDRAFQSVIRRLYGLATSRPAPAQAFYPVLRCLSGQRAARHSMQFHYDSYVVTALMPVEMPIEGQRGDLIMHPNTRRIRRTYLANLADKVLLDNKVTQACIAWCHARGWIRLKRIRLVPGNLYLFWGYRSIHTNEPCDADKVRATALYHFATPHADSALHRRVRGG